MSVVIQMIPHPSECVTCSQVILVHLYLGVVPNQWVFVEQNDLLHGSIL